MATDNTQTKAAAKNDKDTPTIEVKEEAATDATSAAVSKPAPKEEAKPAAAASAPAAKEAPKAAAAPAPAAAKEAPKPTAAPAPAATPAPAAAAAKEAPKPTAAPAPAATPAPAAAAAKEAPKPAAAPAPAAAKEAPKPAAAPAPKAPPTVDTVSRVGRADAIVRRNVLWALGAGIVPFPIFDTVAIAGVQIKMLSELSELYKVSFSDDLAKKLVASLLSSLGGVTLGAAVGASLVKMIPGVGSAIGVVSVPLIGGAATHATGKIFVMHFEAGGTLLDFDPHRMRSHYKQEFEKAKQTVADMKNEQAKAAKPA